MSEIIPAIIPRSPEEISEKVHEVRGEAKTLQIDVLPETFSPEGLKVEMDFEAHFMFPGSHRSLGAWLDAGAKRVIVQFEDFEDGETLSEALLNIRSRAEVGLAVKLETDLEKVFPHLSEVDFLQLMSIAVIGEQGHPFDERIFDRIKEVKEKFPEAVISIDGGVGVENFQRLTDLGADRLVVGHNFKNVWSLMNK